MLVAGVDVGSLTAEAVILEDEKIIAYEIIGVRPSPVQSATEVMEKTLAKTGLKLDDIEFCVSTGYGREKIPFADKSISEISCHGKGAQWSDPSIRTVIDIGGQDCKVIHVDENGDLVDFIMNDKCAAGTGRFLEIIAKTLGVDVSDLGPLSLKSKNPSVITSMCSVFAEYETMFLLAEGKDRVDIAAGVNKAMARRVYALVQRLGIRKEVAITGGVAKNVGVVKSLEELLRTKLIKFTIDPQIIGALGAALFAKEFKNRSG